MGTERASQNKGVLSNFNQKTPKAWRGVFERIKGFCVASASVFFVSACERKIKR